MSNPPLIREFIRRWQASGAAERANFPQFAVELCDVLGVPHPEPTTPFDDQNAYVFERSRHFLRQLHSSCVVKILRTKPSC